MARWRNYLEVVSAGQHTVAGTLKVLPAVRSPQLGNRRDLLVWLPPSYEQGDARYAVLYMHDGQNLFDEATSYAGEWQVDETMQALSLEGLEVIVVGIPNAGEQRPCEYSPFADWPEQGRRGEAYLAFVVDTVKPLIDRDFRTLGDRAHTRTRTPRPREDGKLTRLLGSCQHRRTMLPVPLGTCRRRGTGQVHDQLLDRRRKRRHGDVVVEDRVPGFVPALLQDPLRRHVAEDLIAVPGHPDRRAL